MANIPGMCIVKSGRIYWIFDMFDPFMKSKRNHCNKHFFFKTSLASPEKLQHQGILHPHYLILPQLQCYQTSPHFIPIIPSSFP